MRTNRELYITWENSDLSGQVYGVSAAHVSSRLRLPCSAHGLRPAARVRRACVRISPVSDRRSVASPLSLFLASWQLKMDVFYFHYVFKSMLLFIN